MHLLYKALVAKAGLRGCEFQQLSHSPYTPDLALCDFHLLKGHLCGKHLEDDNELKTAPDEILYLSGIEKLRERYNKCIAVRGGYIKKLS